MTDQQPDAVPPIEPAPAAPMPPPVSPYPQQPVPYGYALQPGQVYAPGYYYGQPTPPRGLSIASMILGIVGVVFSLGYGLGLFPSIAAIITGHLAMKKQPQGRGFWIAGLICGYGGLLLSLIGVAILVFVIVAVTTEGFGDPNFGDLRSIILQARVL